MAVRLQEARVAAGFEKQAALARALCAEGESLATVQTNVSRWERGTPPTAAALAALSRVLGCSIDWLVTGEGSPPVARVVPEENESAGDHAAE
jgi:transcriptional regulator with XRE-family HTH domain